jgi:5-methylcytosine-specific restriction protein A
MKITDQQVEASYLVATRVYSKELTSTEGARILHEHDGLNINSARDFINDYRHMINGELFCRAMSAPAIGYYLSMIWRDKGSAALTNAVAAVRAHIDYYENLRNVKLNKMRETVDDIASKLSSPINLAAFHAEFLKQVERALTAPAEETQDRLRYADKLPKKIKAWTEVYVRNAYVVAEVLRRASGVCGGCKKHAPFKRKKDSSPYLEVHHIKQLADQGEDTVENAIALCPNCHRERHFGLAYQ